MTRNPFTARPSRWFFCKYIVKLNADPIALVEYIDNLGESPKEVDELMRRFIENTLNEKFESFLKAPR